MQESLREVANSMITDHGEASLLVHQWDLRKGRTKGLSPSSRPSQFPSSQRKARCRGPLASPFNGDLGLSTNPVALVGLDGEGALP